MCVCVYVCSNVCRYRYSVNTYGSSSDYGRTHLEMNKKNV